MSFTPTRYCRNGHDKDALGRVSSGRCAECRRLYHRAYRDRKNAASKQYRRERGGEAYFRVPVEPLRDRAQMFRNRNQGMELKTRYQREFQESWDTTARSWERITNGKTETVREDIADRWCIVLGVHPVELWPEWGAE